MKQKLYAYIVFGFGLLLPSGYIQAHCCKPPANHCKNTKVIKDGFIELRSDGGKGDLQKIKLDDKDGVTSNCVECGHPIDCHQCNENQTKDC